MYVSHVHVCIHGVCNSTVHRGVQTRIAKVQLATGLVILWRQIGGGTLDKAPRLLRTGARVRYHFGGFPPHTSSEENTDSPFSKRLIHSISVKWSAERVPCFLSFLPVCARTLQATVARAAIWVRYRK